MSGYLLFEIYLELEIWNLVLHASTALKHLCRITLGESK